MTNQEIKNVGQTIAQETQIGGNTAARVGGVVEGIGVALDNKDAANGYYQATINGGTITVNAPNYLLGSGGNLRIKMPSAGTTASTLTIGNASAVQLWYNGAAVSAQNTWDAGEIISVFYDGTKYMSSNSQGGGGDAEKINYDNSQSGLASNNMQGALDEVHGETVLTKSTGFNPSNESQYNASLPCIRITVANGGFTAEVIRKKGTSTADYVAGITCTSLKAGKTYEIEFDYVSGWSGSFQIRDASFNTDGNIFGVHTAGSGHISIVKTLTSDSGSFTFLLPQNTAVGKTLVVSNLVITEVTSLKDKVNGIDAELNFNLKKQITPVTGSYYKLDVSIGSVANTIISNVPAWQYARIPVEEGDVVCITGNSGDVPRLWGYLGSDFTLLDVAAPSISGRNLVKTIPSGVSYIVINSTVNSNPKWLFAKAGSAGADELLAYKTQQELDDITADAIDASGLECSVVKISGSGTTITIENTSENNYLIHCIKKVGYTYVLIKLPTYLEEGKQYKITYTYSSTSSSTANFVFANSSRSKTAYFSSFLANTQNRKVSVVFTHQSDYVYLMTYNNDISTGADITINDLTITVTHSITEIEDRISALEPTVTPSAYYNGMHVELGNDYGYIFTTTSTSIRCNEGMAMYGDYLVCAMLAAGTTYLNIYKQTDNVYGLVASLTNLSLSHANAMQFAPTLESGQTFPLLYVAGCDDRKCYVVQISVTSETVEEVTTDTYSASIVQTISFPTTKPFATTEHMNAQIGDDGYLYVYSLTNGCTRLRCPQVSEGATITMTEDDIYDYYEFYYPFATYVWQGGVIHKGMLFMPVGNSNKTKCLFVFDIYNHSLKALINLDAFMSSGKEPEDAEVYNGELYIAMYAGASATSSKAMKKIKFL